MSTTNTETQSAVPSTIRTLATALGGQTRIEMLYLLTKANGPLYQYELAEAIGVSEPAISRAKSKLVSAGLVTEVGSGLTVPSQVEKGLSAFIHSSVTKQTQPAPTND